MDKKLPELKEKFYTISDSLTRSCADFKDLYDTWDLNSNKNVGKLKDKMKEKIILGTNDGK